MPRDGYTNLSVDAKAHAKIRRDFEKADMGLSFPVWATDVVRSAIDRMEYLKIAYPDLKLISVQEDSLVIEDKKKNIMVKVYKENDKLVSMPEGPEYLIYAGIRPEMKF